MLLLATVAVSFLFVGICGKLAFRHLKDTGIRKSHLFSYAIVPLAFVFECGYQLRPLFSRMGQFFPILGQQFGVPLEFLDFSTPAAAAKPWQILVVLLGVAVSLLVQREIAKVHERAGQKHLGYLKSIPVLLLASVYIGLFAVM